MKIVVFGLSVSSSWGNGHATLWRGLCHALAEMGHRVTFFERDVPYYAKNRDLGADAAIDLRLYASWAEALPDAERAVAAADVAVVTSYCPDGAAAADIVLAARGKARIFYDLDTPATLERLAAGERVPYLPEHGLADFDLVLSYTGGATLTELRARTGARDVAPLYGSVDPHAHYPVAAEPRFLSDLSYLGTYSADRQAGVERLFVEPARRLPAKKFLLGGPMYGQDFPWTANIHYLSHVAPPEHPAFYGSSRFTLNVTRGSFARLGYCPSGRLFEAAACGVPIVSDAWEGLDRFFEPGREIVVAETADDVVRALAMPGEELAAIAARARRRALAEHTAACRARELVALVTGRTSRLPENDRTIEARV